MRFDVFKRIFPNLGKQARLIPSTKIAMIDLDELVPILIPELLNLVRKIRVSFMPIDYEPEVPQPKMILNIGSPERLYTTGYMKIKPTEDGIYVEKVIIRTNQPDVLEAFIQNALASKTAALKQLLVLNPKLINSKLGKVAGVLENKSIFDCKDRIKRKQAQFDELKEGFIKSADFEEKLNYLVKLAEFSSAAERALVGFIDDDKFYTEMKKRAELMGDGTILEIRDQVLSGEFFKEADIWDLYQIIEEYDKKAKIIKPLYEDKVTSAFETIFGEIKQDLQKVSSVVIDGIELTADKLAQILKTNFDKLSDIWKALLSKKATIELLIKDFPRSFLSAPSSFRREIIEFAKEMGL